MLRNSGHPQISAIDYNEQRDGCQAKNDPVFDEYKAFYCTVEWILPFIRHNFHFGKKMNPDKCIGNGRRCREDKWPGQ